MVYVFLIVLWLILAATADILARRKHRSGWAWGLLTLACPLFLLPLLALPAAPPRDFVPRSAWTGRDAITRATNRRGPK